MERHKAPSVDSAGMKGALVLGVLSDSGSKPSRVKEDAPNEHSRLLKLSPAMTLIALGVVYGDIGTSPMYVMKAIINGNGGLESLSEDVVLGALSLIVWTITLMTTVKYVVVALRADNHNEGGIFALYSLVRRCGAWLVLPAMLGGAALLADGILTPAVTVTTAVEGLRSVSFGQSLIGDSQLNVVVIAVVILSVLFLVQRAGTSSIGKAFGPVMTLWFLFLGAMGIMALSSDFGVLRALNPVRGIVFLFSPHNAAGFMVLGSVFLATTGAEALYSDMGHVGKANIRASWPFVKICLLLNYFGQGAWILANVNNAAVASIEDMNPFYEMLPAEIRLFAVGLSTAAAIIASQALITGSYTLVSEATRLDLMPHLRVLYPAQTKGQLYIPLVNTVMWIGCIGVVILFQSSSNMEAAYGLAITLTMLMTTLLMAEYLARVRHRVVFALAFALVFGAIEMAFFLSSLAKFVHGGYVTIFIALALLMIMVVWHRGTAIERAQSVFLPVKDYVEQLSRLRSDVSIPLLSENLVFLTNGSKLDTVDRDVLYSILDGKPKRALAYWFVNVVVTEDPYTRAYTVNDFGTDEVFKVQLQLGFRVDQHVNVYLRQIVDDLIDSGELLPQKRTYSTLADPGEVGDFRFCLIRKMMTTDTDLKPLDRRTLSAKYAIRRMCGSPAQWYGLWYTTIMFEYVPLFGKTRTVMHLERLPLESVICDQSRDDDEDEGTS